MELYEEDDDVDDMDEEVILEDEKALSGKHMHMKLIHHNWLNCVLLNLRSIRCFYLAINRRLVPTLTCSRCCGDLSLAAQPMNEQNRYELSC